MQVGVILQHNKQNKWGTIFQGTVVAGIEIRNSATGGKKDNIKHELLGRLQQHDPGRLAVQKKGQHFKQSNKL